MSEPITVDLGAVTAYADAVEQGYTGTREEFGELLANFAKRADEAKEDRNAVEQAKEEVFSKAESFDKHVEDEKNRVTEEFNSNAEQVLNTNKQELGTVKDSALEEIVQTKEESVTEVTNTKNSGVKEITDLTNTNKSILENTGTNQKNLIESEGTKQIQEVENKGTATLATIPEDYTALNTSVNDLKDLMHMKAPAIVEEATSGKEITVNDSADGMRLQGLNVYGKSWQKTTTGSNLFKITKTPETLKGITFDVRKDGTIKVSGTNTESSELYVILGTFEVVAGQTYIFNNFYSLESNDIETYVQIKNDIVLAKINAKEKDRYMYTAKETGVLNVRFKVREGVTIDTTLSEMQINIGETVLPYEPYTGGKPSPSSEYPQEIQCAGYQKGIEVGVTGKNLFDFSKLNVNYGLNVKDKTITIPPKTNNVGYYNSLKELCPGIKAGDTYVLSAKTSNPEALRVVHLVDTNIDFNFGKAFIPTEEQINDKMAFYNNQDTEKENVISEIQLEKGSEATTYEPYKQPQSLPITTPTGLPAIPVPSGTSGITYTDADGQAWIADEIDFARGKYIQRVWQAEFDGSNDEKWSRYSVRTGWVLRDGLPENMKARAGFCNEKKVGILDDDAIQLGSKSTNDNKMFYPSSKYYDTSLSDYGISNWKAHLAERPLKVMTYLDNPIETDLSEEQIQAYKAIHTNKPTTIISSDANVWMGASYAADTKLYIDNKVQEIASAVIASASEAE